MDLGKKGPRLPSGLRRCSHDNLLDHRTSHRCGPGSVLALGMGRMWIGLLGSYQGGEMMMMKSVFWRMWKSSSVTCRRSVVFSR